MAIVKVLAVAPGSGTPSLNHCTVGVGDPVAAPEKLTLAPAKTVWLEGEAVITGAVSTAATVRIAASESVAPSALRTSAW